MMFSSIFKSLALGTVLFASQASAQILNWDINFLQVLTDFDNGSTNELTLNYDIGTGATSYQVDLFDKGCVDDITGTTVGVTPSKTAKDASHDSLEVLVDLDKTTIASSNVWDAMNSRIQMCARVQLKAADGMVISEDSRDIDVDFDMLVDFDTASSANFNQALLSSGSSTATVENYVSACTCDSASSFTCNTNTISSSGILNVCIKSLSADMNIDYIQSLVLTQGATELKLYDGGNIQNTAITSGTDVPAKNGVHVASLIPTQFFSYDSASAAQVSGLVYLQLPGSRRLTVEITGKPKVQATASTRALRFDDEQASSLFGEEQASSSFVVDLVLEKKEINAANMQSFFAFSCIAPIITAIAVML